MIETAAELNRIEKNNVSDKIERAVVCDSIETAALCDTKETPVMCDKIVKAAEFLRIEAVALFDR